MSDETRVWIRKRKLKRRCRCRGECRCKPRYAYDLRWIDPDTGKWKSRSAGTDHKRAEREAALLERQLDEGTYRNLRRSSWKDFTEEHISRITGKRNAIEAERTLNEFGAMFDVPPKGVTFPMIESYVESLKTGEAKNSQATINKKLRYLRAAFNKAIRRGYIARSPMEGWQWISEESKAIRIASANEEAGLLKAAESLYGPRGRAFVYVALNTGARRGELLGLTWDRVDFKAGSIHFAHTKGKVDRFVPINPETAAELRRIQAMTLQQGGPFIGMEDNLGRRWGRIIRQAGVEGLSIHDLRRTYVTRLIRAGVPLPTVQKLVGHSDLKTTLRYYNQVSDTDLREGVAKLRKAQGA